jgi:hypothetical protein
VLVLPHVSVVFVHPQGGTEQREIIIFSYGTLCKNRLLIIRTQKWLKLLQSAATECTALLLFFELPTECTALLLFFELPTNIYCRNSSSLPGTCPSVSVVLYVTRDAFVPSCFPQTDLLKILAISMTTGSSTISVFWQLNHSYLCSCQFQTDRDRTQSFVRGMFTCSASTVSTTLKSG